MKIRNILAFVILSLPTFANANAPTLDLPSITIPGPSIEFNLEQSFIPRNIPEPITSPGAALNAVAPKLSAEVAQRALDAMLCAQDGGHQVEKLIVVDMSEDATEKRLWAFDIKDPSKPLLVINERVAHGSGSDTNKDGMAERFSNVPNSNMTSLGLYRIAEKYRGKNGWSRRLDGLLARFNGNARQRAVVMHPSNYVSPQRVGRSQGCPAVSQDTMNTLEKAGLTNAVLWIDGPDQSLKKAVADCAEKRRAAMQDQIALRDEQFFTSSRELLAVSLAPVLNNADWGNHRSAIRQMLQDTAPIRHACNLPTPTSPKTFIDQCVDPIDNKPFAVRLS